MYIQYPIEMLVLLSVSSDPRALAFVWLVIRKLLFCSMMLHRGWKTSICWCTSRSKMEACATLDLALEDVLLLSQHKHLASILHLPRCDGSRLLSYTSPHASTWDQFCASKRNQYRKGLTLVQALGSRGDRSLLIGWFLLRLFDFSLVGNITDHGRISYQTKHWNRGLSVNYDLVLISLN